MTLGRNAESSRHSVTTERLLLLSATPALLEADIAGRTALSGRLRASVPDGWPPDDLAGIRPIFRQQLLDDPTLEGWLLWYWLEKQDEDDMVLVGAGGFAGKPDRDGSVRLGCALPAGSDEAGYALEAFNGLIRWALQYPSVSRVLVPGIRKE